MSISTGIKISNEVVELFNETRISNSFRWFKLVFQDENVVVSDKKELTDDIKADFNSMADCTDEKEPAYFIIRLDSKSSDDTYEYVILWYVPDSSKVKLKMLMSTTLETIRQALGPQYFVGNWRTTLKSELSYDDFTQNWVKKGETSKYVADLMTEAEKQLKEELSMEYMDATQANTQGLAFPIVDDAKQKLVQFQQKQIKSVSIKIENEKFVVDTTGDELVEAPNANPRYIFYILADQPTDLVFFIYSCPSITKVKERMIYSASKSAIMNYAKELNINFDKSVEISDIQDLNTQFLHDYAHPPDPTAPKVQFSKPKRPGKGKARVTAAQK